MEEIQQGKRIREPVHDNIKALKMKFPSNILKGINKLF